MQEDGQLHATPGFSPLSAARSELGTQTRLRSPLGPGSVRLCNTWILVRLKPDPNLQIKAQTFPIPEPSCTPSTPAIRGTVSSEITL